MVEHAPGTNKRWSPPPEWPGHTARRSFGGADISIGQWQKLALARAAMRDEALVIVFDEPTASLDAPTEHALFERFAEAARRARPRGTITLLVSHRFSTVQRADRILVMNDGTITEDGSHAELLRAGGTYAALYEAQARSYR
jgi:ATP-binding cassette subfamily B protein